MKSHLFLAFTLVLSLTLRAAAEQGQDAPAPAAPGEAAPAQVSREALDMAQKEFDAQFCYALGLELAARYGHAPDIMSLQSDMIARGIADGLAGKPAFSKEQMNTLLTEGVNRIQIVEGQKNAEFAKQNAAFLEGNRGKEGVQVTPSGLQYVVLREGQGRQPQPTDMVRVHYTGKLIDGAEFDSSYQRGEPAVFSVQGVIAGWKEALPMMKEGAQWRLFVPAELAYGQRGDGAAIPPNAVLVFELELLSVQ